MKPKLAVLLALLAADCGGDGGSTAPAQPEGHLRMVALLADRALTEELVQLVRLARTLREQRDHAQVSFGLRRPAGARVAAATVGS